MLNAKRCQAILRPLAAALLIAGLAACANHPDAPDVVPSAKQLNESNYLIGTGDQLQIFVWRNQELSTHVAVRPDGKISVPLIDDMQASGHTPTQLAREIEKQLGTYVKDPVVTVMVNQFVGPPSQQIRVVGEAMKPRALQYRTDMTVLDVLIEVGGLTDFAAGNRAVIVRNVNGSQQSFTVRLNSLIKDGDVSANVPVAPGDILIIPQSWL